MSDAPQGWLIFVAKLSAEPSSARVAMWRRLKAAGAASLLTGTWVLPQSETHARLLGQLATTARTQGGSAAVFAAHVVDGMTSEQIVERFHADRAREYDEFATRVDGFGAEIEKETVAEKFSFAELEEVEGDFDKLRTWLAKIEARDFFAGDRRIAAVAMLQKCEQLLRTFAELVYERDGVADEAAT